MRTSARSTPCSVRRTRHTIPIALFAALLLLFGAGSALAQTDLAVAISPGAPEPVAAGEEFIYQVAAANLGPVATTGVAVSITLPNISAAGPPVTYDMLMNHLEDDGGCTFAAPTLTCAIGAFAVGETRSIRIMVRVAPDAALPSGAAVLPVTASIGGAAADPNPANDSDTITTAITERADLRVTKYVQPVETVPGGKIFTYTIWVDNWGPSVAREVYVRDTMLTGSADTIDELAIQSCAFSVSQGGGAITQFTCTTGPLVGTQFGSDVGQFRTNVLWPWTDADGDLATTNDVIHPGRLRASFRVVAYMPLDPVNTTTAAALTPDPDTSNNMAEVTIEVVPEADLAITMTDNGSPVTAGETASWTMTVTNNGPSDATNVRLLDVLPAAIVNGSVSAVPSQGSCTLGTPGNPAEPLACDLGTILDGATATVTIAGDVVPDFFLSQPATGAAYNINNDASVTSETHDPGEGNNRATDFIAVTESADLVLRTFIVGTPVAGGMVHYEYQIDNAGPSVSRDVTLRDFLPSQVEFIRAMVDYENGLGSVPLVCDVTAGSNVLFCPLGDVPITGTNPIMVFVSVRIEPDATGSITNGADLNLHDTTDPIPANNATSVTTALRFAASLAVTKTAVASSSPGVPNAAGGGTVTFRIAVANEGPSTAYNVAVTDPLGPSFTYLSSTSAACTAGAPVTCVLGALDPGESREFDLTVSVADDLAGIASIQNCATAGWTLGDATTHATSDCETVPTAGADLAVTAARTAEEQQVNQAGLAFQGKIPAQLFPTAPNYFASTRVTAGRRIEYSFTVSNAGPWAAKNVVLTGSLPEGIEYYFGSLTAPAGVNCEILAPGDTLRCAVGTLAALGTATVSLQVITDPALEPNTTLASGAAVASDTPDPVNGNNVANTQTAVMDAADFAVNILPASTWVVGEMGVLEIQVKNDGPTIARDAALFITTPAQLVFDRAFGMYAGIAVAAAAAAPGDLPCVVASPTQVICSLGRQQVTTVLGQGGGSAPLRVFAWFRIREDVPAPPTLTITASATSFTWDPLAVNNADTEDVDTGASPPAGTADLAIALASDLPEFSPGQEVSYLVEVTNNGPAVAHDVQVTDELPKQFVLTGADLGGGAGGCTVDGGLLCALGDLAAAEVRTFTVRGYVKRRTASRAVISNGVSVVATDPDPVPENNYAILSTRVRVRNIVDNAGFEDLPIGPPWQELSTDPGDGQDCLVAHDGGCSYLLQGVAGVEKRLRQDMVFNGKKGDQIEVSAFSKAKNVSGSGSYRVELRAYLANGWRTFATQSFGNGTHGWQKRSITMTAPWNFRALAVVVKFKKMTGKAWFDDVKVKVRPGSMP